MAKYNIYAIAYGIDPVLVEPVSNLKFRTWDDCKPYVIGVEGAKYKGFLTEEEADTWLLQKAENFEKNVTCLNTSEKLEKKNLARYWIIILSLTDIRRKICKSALEKF